MRDEQLALHFITSVELNVGNQLHEEKLELIEVNLIRKPRRHH